MWRKKGNASDAVEAQVLAKGEDKGDKGGKGKNKGEDEGDKGGKGKHKGEGKGEHKSGSSSSTGEDKGEKGGKGKSKGEDKGGKGKDTRDKAKSTGWGEGNSSNWLCSHCHYLGHEVASWPSSQMSWTRWVAMEYIDSALGSRDRSAVYPMSLPNVYIARDGISFRAGICDRSADVMALGAHELR